MTSQITPLGQDIARLIAHEGPIGIDRYMALCLGHPHHGYYMTRDPFGAAGDFITAPEISQMFGELIGLWAVAVWQQMGMPAKCRLIEMGPGRGTLMVDVLRAAKAMPAFREAVSVHLVETSPFLRKIQQETLNQAGFEPVWHEIIDTALDGPVIVIANELLDALPVRQFVKTPEGWREKLVGLGQDGALAFGLSGNAQALATGNAAVDAISDGTVLEAAGVAHELVRTVSRHIVASGGAALFIDYGASASGFGDTLQAMKRHAFVDPLETPGEADLTVHVDFSRLALAARSWGAVTHGPEKQGDFLETLGLSHRVATLKARATPEQKRAIEAAAKRLTDPDTRGMGTLFKALAISSPDLTELPGFASLVASAGD
jgi:NADH dehydrogenase [ubiquinone] 1 alpha subcomplex assembly factor 7